MKRSWIGAGMLLALLLAGILVTYAMDSLHSPIAEALDAAGEAALTENWEPALDLHRRARERWDRNEVFRGCFASHEATEQINSCFAQLAVYGSVREPTAFAALCRDTARKVAAIGEAHRLQLHNFF